MRQLERSRLEICITEEDLCRLMMGFAGRVLMLEVGKVW